MTPDEIERDLKFAIDAARQAGTRVLKLRESGRYQASTLAAIEGYLTEFRAQSGQGE